MAKQVDVIIIGAGLTGLTLGFTLRQRGIKVALLESSERVGGQIQTHYEKGYTFESGPNTGVVATPEVVELFEEVERATGKSLLETANPKAKKRLIWKKGRFLPIPNGPWSGITTPLVSLGDKIRLLFEPWRAKGTNPDESIAEMTRRRLGDAFVRYFVDPFVSGIYAGDPERIVVRWAMPKLYDLEQQHGSFIRGAYAKRKAPKSEREKRVTKAVFSTVGGMEVLTAAMAEVLTDEIEVSCQKIQLSQEKEGWRVVYHSPQGQREIVAPRVVTTVPAYALPELLPFVEKGLLAQLTAMTYAPVVQVGVGIRTAAQQQLMAFGGLIPSVEQEELLGILFPSSCFSQRAPEGGVTLSFFLGGVKKPHLIEKTDEELVAIVTDALHRMLGFPKTVQPEVVKVFRHPRAIPQYEANTKERLAAVTAVEKAYKGLTLAGNLKDGVGMAHRITQARKLAASFVESV